jgi:hypothetical protein
MGEGRPDLVPRQPTLALQVLVLLPVLEILDRHVDLRVVLHEALERLGGRALVGHRVANPLHVLSGVLGLEHPLHEQQRGARVLRVDRDAEVVAADRDPLLALLELEVLGVVDRVADVHDVAVPEVLDPGVAARHVGDRVRRDAAQLRLEIDEVVE